jgi:hypothetical protein
MSHIERVAKRDGVSFAEAARRCGKKGARVRRNRRREALGLTAVQSTWAWKRDFE